MTSKKKIEANRQNAQKSSGPKTTRGKGHSSNNAITHGFHTRRLLPGEDIKRNLEIWEELRNNLRPIGTLQESIVDQIFYAILRTKRVDRAEDYGIWKLIKEQARFRIYGPRLEVLRIGLPPPEEEEEEAEDIDIEEDVEPEDVDAALYGGMAGRDGETSERIRLARRESLREVARLLSTLRELQKMTSEGASHSDVPPVGQPADNAN